MKFVVGQRWVSNADMKLGLGIISECSGRQVVVSFPAVGERRVYSIENAPLSRILYRPGDQVCNQEEDLFKVVDVHDQNGLMIYKVIDDQGRESIMDELELNSFVQFSRPEQRLFSGQFDKNALFELRVETLNIINKLQQSPVKGLLASRTSLLSHQIYIAYQVAQRFAPRVLLADEVGLGKTIEAGLIVHYQLHTGLATRVLLVVPNSLVHQWLVEMLRRFNLRFSVFDQERYQALIEGGHENPFDSGQLILCSLDFITQNDDVKKSLEDSQWDLLLLDEAHHLHWSESEVSPEYQSIETLAARSQGLLLLTATPEQVGIESHFARLRLLDPARFHSLETFKQEESSYQTLNQIVQQLIEDIDKPLDQSIIDQVTQYYHVSAEKPEQLSRNRLIEQLLDRHGTGRVLFRNTRAAIKGFPKRILHAYPLGCPDLYKVDGKGDGILFPELSADEKSWIKEDPRVAWLVGLLKELLPSKVLVICANAKTAIALEHFLHLRAGIRSAAFYEGLSIIERDRAAAYFSEQEGGAQTLICSEIGSEGRNFQFAQHLVLFDLPLNPDLLEQRIGRLDRIGQQADVNIHAPYLKGSAQEVLFRWFSEGINLFEKSCAAAYSIYKKFEQELKQHLHNPGMDMSELISKTRTYTVEVLDNLESGRDRLLELNSCNTKVAQYLIEQIVQTEQGSDLEDYMAKIFDVYGVDHEYHSESAQVLHPSDHMRTTEFPGLRDEGNTVVFSRQRALLREDMEFLSWEHPMVVDSMDMFLGSELGNVCLATIKASTIKPGSLLLECVYTVNCIAPKYLQLERFLPLSPTRVLMDKNNQDYSSKLSHTQLNSHREDIKRSTGLAIIKQVRDEINSLLDLSDRTVQKKLPAVREKARLDLGKVLGAEISRLQALQKHNPSIRDEEIEYLQKTLDSSDDYISKASFQLQALRVIVAT